MKPRVRNNNIQQKRSKPPTTPTTTTRTWNGTRAARLKRQIRVDVARYTSLGALLGLGINAYVLGIDMVHDEWCGRSILYNIHFGGSLLCVVDVSRLMLLVWVKIQIQSGGRFKRIMESRLYIVRVYSIYTPHFQYGRMCMDDVFLVFWKGAASRLYT